MRHNIQVADAKAFLLPHKCLLCAKSINIFAKAVTCQNQGCHVKLHEKCFKKHGFPDNCEGKPPSSSAVVAPGTAVVGAPPGTAAPPPAVASAPGGLVVPPGGGGGGGGGVPVSGGGVSLNVSAPPGSIPYGGGYQQQQQQQQAYQPGGYQQQQQPAFQPAGYQSQPQQQPYQPQQYQQQGYPAGAPYQQQGYSPQQQGPPNQMLASMNLNASYNEPVPPSYQGAAYNQVLYNGAPLQVSPWHQQQQQQHPWQQQSQQQPPPMQGFMPPVQYQQQYPTLGKTEPITNYYDIGDILGKGAFSEVRDCRCKRTGNVYAVKIMKKDYNDKRTMDITYMELRVFKRIEKGPHCVHMVDMFESPNHYYLVLEKITGGELFQQITKLKKYSEKGASKLVEQMLLGIHHLWSSNIVHRDLKPENLLLSSKEDDADLLITDFGLSFILQRADEMMTHPVGTPGYVAPELVMCMDTQGRTSYSKSVDMWAAGVIIYIMLCGFPPFMGQDTNETFAKIKALSFSFPSPWWDDVSNSAKDLICHCLDPDPNRRYSPIDALNHPWIKLNKELNEEHLAGGVEELKRFNAKRKLKGAMHAVRLAVKAQSLLVAVQTKNLEKAEGGEKQEEKQEEKKEEKQPAIE